MTSNQSHVSSSSVLGALYGGLEHAKTTWTKVVTREVAKEEKPVSMEGPLPMKWAGKLSDSPKAPPAKPARVVAPVDKTAEAPKPLPVLEPLFEEQKQSTGVVVIWLVANKIRFFTCIHTFEEWRNTNLRGTFERQGRVMLFRKGKDGDIVCMQTALITNPLGTHAKLAVCQSAEGFFFSSWNVAAAEKTRNELAFYSVIDAYPEGYFPKKYLAEHPKSMFTEGHFVHHADDVDHYACFYENSYSSGIILIDAGGIHFFGSKKEFVAYSKDAHSGVVPERRGFILVFGKMGYAFPAPPLPHFHAFFNKLTIFVTKDGTLRVGWGDRHDNIDYVERTVIPAYTQDYTKTMFKQNHRYFEGGDRAFVAIEGKNGSSVDGWGNIARSKEGILQFEFTATLRTAPLLSVKGLVKPDEIPDEEDVVSEDAGTVPQDAETAPEDADTAPKAATPKVPVGANVKEVKRSRKNKSKAAPAAPVSETDDVASKIVPAEPLDGISTIPDGVSTIPDGVSTIPDETTSAPESALEKARKIFEEAKKAFENAQKALEAANAANDE